MLILHPVKGSLNFEVYWASSKSISLLASPQDTESNETKTDFFNHCRQTKLRLASCGLYQFSFTDVIQVFKAIR